MNPEYRKMPSPENLRGLYNGYIEAIAKHQVDGQNSKAAQEDACIFEEHDPTEGPNRHYWIDYKFKTRSGQSLFLRFRHAGHIPANNIEWSTNKGEVHYYVDGAGDLMLLHAGGGAAWFNPGPTEHEANHYAQVPTMANVEVRSVITRASHGWLDTYLNHTAEAYSSRIRKEVAQAIDKYHAGETLPPKPCTDWENAEEQLNKYGAEHFPEYLDYLLTELSQATGIMSFKDWVQKQKKGKKGNPRSG